jgi:hypothetical protein
MTKAEWIKEAEVALKAMRKEMRQRKRSETKIERLRRELREECDHVGSLCLGTCPFLTDKDRGCTLALFRRLGKRLGARQLG